MAANRAFASARRAGARAEQVVANAETEVDNAIFPIHFLTNALRTDSGNSRWGGNFAVDWAAVSLGEEIDGSSGLPGAVNEEVRTLFEGEEAGTDIQEFSLAEDGDSGGPAGGGPVTLQPFSARSSSVSVSTSWSVALSEACLTSARRLSIADAREGVVVEVLEVLLYGGK